MFEFPRLRSLSTRWMQRRNGGVLLFLLMFCALSMGVRLALLAKAAGDVTWDLSLGAAFFWGLVFDLGAAAWFSVPLIILLALLPSGMFRRWWARVAMSVVALFVLFALLFDAVAEWVFWDEFGVRFNFIAVDYLVYTSELLGNIRESYPMPWIFGGIFVGAVVLFAVTYWSGLPSLWLKGEHAKLGPRLIAGGIWLGAAVCFGSVLASSWVPVFANNYNREIASNGIWSLFAAFRSNDLDYERFYETLPAEEAFASLRHELIEDGSVLLRPDEYDALRLVTNTGPELHPNIIQITVESLSAEFLGCLNPGSALTPELDALAEESLLFDNFYATGTRTVRGMEALTLSVPPTPGQSIVKRPVNSGLFTLGSVLETRGYDTAFIYGGYGYFDNMNAYFGANGYRVVDRGSVASDDVTFSNVWGACDEDLLRWTMREADKAADAETPFHFFVMTTSNHRPFTYPDRKIDLPSKVSGRAGAVKYTDFAIGQFIREASAKPWFDHTIFVIVADHCASSAGKTQVPVDDYHIPLLIYAPGGQIKPGRISTLMSQMDYAPTLLGLLNWSYPSRFIGHDVRRIEPDDAHALIATYQMLGHLERDELVILEPRLAVQGFMVDPVTSIMTECEPSDDGKREAVGFYQAASYLYHNDLHRALTAGELARFSHPGGSLASSEELETPTH